MKTSARILYLDHDNTRRSRLEKSLRRKGYTVLSAASGEGGLEALKNAPVDVVLSRFTLPDMHGLELLRRLRARQPQLSCVFLGAEEPLPRVVEAMKQGAADFVTEPCRPDSLVRTLEQALAAASQKPPSGVAEAGREYIRQLEAKLKEWEQKAFSLGLANVNMLAIQEQLEEKNQQMEKLLAELSRRTNELQAILDTSPAAIVMVDLQNRITAANQRIFDFFALKRETVLHRSFDFFLKKIAPCFEDFSLFQLHTGQIEQFCRDGDPQAFNIRELYSLAMTINKPRLRAVLPFPASVKGHDGQELGKIWIFEDVTQLKRADEFLRTVVEASPIPIIVSRFSDGKILFANEPVAKILGKSVADILDMSTPDFYFDLEDRKIVLEKLRSRGFLRDHEVRVKTANGEALWMIFSLAITELNGEKVIIGAFYDINARRRAEEALRESEERFRQLTENIHEAFWMYDVKTGKPIYLSPAFESITGLNREALAESFAAVASIIHPEDLQRVMAAIPKKFQSEYGLEYRIIRPDGQVRWIAERAFPIRNTAGEVYRICGVGADITTRKKAEAALRKSHDELEIRVQERTAELATLNETLRASEVRNIALLNAIPDLMFRLNREGIYLDYKAPRDSDLAVPPEEVIGKTVFQTLPPKLARQTLENLERVLQTGEALSMEYELPHNEHLHYFEARLVVSGKDEVLAIVRDITARKHAEEALRKAHEELEQRVEERTADLARANRELRETQAQLIQSEKMAALGTLVAGVAHEINTPVGAINSMHDTLVRAMGQLKKRLGELFPQDVSTDAKLAATFKVIEDANRVIAAGSGRVTNIVRRLRSFARLDEAELKETDIHEGLEDTLVLIHHEIKHNLQLLKNYGEIPQIRCYPGRLNQVFLNLLINAKQALQGRENGAITITTWRKDGSVHVSIADNGVGIPPKNLSRIFDPGFTTKGVGVGTGLGLSIVYRIIKEDHRGEITVQSKEGEGTVFTVSIPEGLGKGRNEGNSSH